MADHADDEQRNEHGRGDPDSVRTDSPSDATLTDGDGERIDRDPPENASFDSAGVRVVLCVDDPGTRQSLREWFVAHGHDVETGDARSHPDDGDLYVVDQGSLRRTAPEIGALKANQEAFLPCLLVAASEHANRIARSEDEALDVVDDVLHIPLQTPALRRRVESLQRARQLSKELRDSTARYQSLVDVLPAGLFVLDDAGTVTYVNDAGKRLLRDDADTQLTGKQLLEFVHPDDRDDIAACVGPDAIEPDDPPVGPLKVRLQFSSDSQTGTPRLTVDTGETHVVVEVTITALSGDAGHQVLVHDVTERERRLERLRVFERAIEEAAVGLTIADAQADDDPLVFVNEGFVDLTGYEEADVLGRNCRFLQGEDTDPETVAEIRDALEAERPVSLTIKNYRADGTPFWNHLDLTPIRDQDGDVTHFLGFQRDVTDRRERIQLFKHLHDATKQLQRARTPTAVAEVAVEAMLDILELDVAECWFPAEDGTRLDTVALDGTEFGHPLWPTDDEWEVFTEQIRVMEVPVVDHDVPMDRGIVFSLGEYGVIGAADAERAYTDALKDAGRVLADQVTVALDRADREAELADTKDDLEHTLERINDGFMAMNADFEVTYLNEQGEAMFPFDFQDAMGTVIWDLSPEAVGGPFWDGYHDALESQEPQTFEAYDSQMESWFEVSAYPSPDGLTVYFRDITKSRERKRELERYERIVQTAGDPIYSLDETGQFRDVNPAFVELTGYDRESITGEFAGLVLDDTDVERCERAIRKLLDRDDIDHRTVELTVITKSGERRRCEVAIAPLPGEAFSGTVGVIRDVTELKDNEQRLAVLDRVLRHNLRNNLNVVAGRASSLTDHEDETVADVASIVERAAEDVLDMAEKARAFQQALGKSRTETTEADLCEIVADVVDNVSTTKVDATVSCSVDADGPLLIQANEAVQLAVRELVDNAITHNPSAEPTVTVDVFRENGDAVVRVADDGPPIPPQEIDVLGGEGTVETPLDHASGIGLWLVHWTATSFGGDLAFDTSDEGNVVTLCFPLTSH